MLVQNNANLTFRVAHYIISVMKIIEKLSKFKHDYDLSRYLKNHQKEANGMTVKEINHLIDSVTGGADLEKAPVVKGGLKRTYQEVLESVKSGCEFENMQGREL